MSGELTPAHLARPPSTSFPCFTAQVSISIDTPSMGAAALLRWGFGHRWQSVMAPLRRGFSLVPFRLGPECSLGVCEFYLTIHIPRQVTPAQAECPDISCRTC